MNHIADGLVVAAQLLCDNAGMLAAPAGEQDLAAAQHKGVGGREFARRPLPIRNELQLRQMIIPPMQPHIEAMAEFTTIALRNASRVMMSDGFKSSKTMPTIRLPVR